MQIWTLKQVLVVLREPGGSVGFGVLIGTTGSHISPLPEVREMTFGRWAMVSQVPEEFWILDNHSFLDIWTA